MAGVVRAGLCFFAFVLLSSKGTHGKPFFPGLWCDMICIEYDDGLDDNASTTTTLEQLMDSIWDPCSGCPVRPSRTTTTTPNPRGFMPWSLIFPSSMVGMNITSLNGGPPGGGYIIQPWNGGMGMPPMPFPATPAPIPAASTAAPSATTAAPGATTAAAGATTVAPTTAAAG